MTHTTAAAAAATALHMHKLIYLPSDNVLFMFHSDMSRICDSIAKWYLKDQSCLDDEENTGIRSNGPQQLVCHPAHHYKQQQLQLQQCSDTQNSSRSSGNSTIYAQTICLPSDNVLYMFHSDMNRICSSLPPPEPQWSLLLFF